MLWWWPFCRLTNARFSMTLPYGRNSIVPGMLNGCFLKMHWLPLSRGTTPVSQSLH